MRNAELLKLALMKRERFFMAVALLAVALLAAGCPSSGGGTMPSIDYVDQTVLYVSIGQEMFSTPVQAYSPNFDRILISGPTPFDPITGYGTRFWAVPKATTVKGPANVDPTEFSITVYPMGGPQDGKPVVYTWKAGQGGSVVVANGQEIHDNFEFVDCAIASWITGPWISLFCVLDEVVDPNKAIELTSKWFEINANGEDTYSITWSVTYTASRAGYLPREKNVVRIIDFDIDNDKVPNWDDPDPFDPEIPGEGDPVMVEVPDVIGKTLTQGSSTLASVDLVLGNVEYVCSNADSGTIVDQDPNPGVSVEENSAVDVWVSTGPAALEVTIDSPANNFVCSVGDEVNFTVTVTGGSGNRTYRWHFPDNDFKYQEDVVKIFDMPGTGIVYLDVRDLTTGETVRKSISVSVLQAS